MNMLNRTLACLMVTTLISPFVVGAEELQPQPQQALRYLKLAEKLENGTGAGDQCSIPLKDMRIDLNDDDEDIYNCVNDQMSYFQLDNARSAVVIKLEKTGCSGGGGWVVGFKTYIDPVTTPWLSIAGLKGLDVGAIYSRGVMVTHKLDTGDDTKGELTCVEIDVSDLP